MTQEKKKLTDGMIADEILQFRKQYRTLILSTCSESQQPLASYAPFIEDEQGNFYLLLSGLAEHSTNLKNHEKMHKPVSVLLIEDEQQARNHFARKRLSYSCSVAVYSRDALQWPVVIKQMQERLGKTIEVLSSLSDFSLYCLTPRKGNYVRGFGQAYEINESGLPIHINKESS